MELWEFIETLIGRGREDVLWWQMTVRAALVFLYAVALYRLLPRRAIGGSAAIDIVLAVIVGSSLSRALTGNAPLPETLAAVSAMSALYYAMTALARRSDRFAALVKGRSIPLVSEGRVVEDGLRSALYGHSELCQHLRLGGVEEVERVRIARLERDGSVSVFTCDP